MLIRSDTFMLVCVHMHLRFQSSAFFVQSKLLAFSVVVALKAYVFACAPEALNVQLV